MKRNLLFICLFFLITSLSKAQTVTYNADTVTQFANPERGWFIFLPLKPTFFNNSNNWANAAMLDSFYNRGFRVAKHIVILPTKTGPLPQSFIDQLQAEVDLIRTKGFKIFYRFNYNWNQSISPGDATESNTVAHLTQLQPFFSNNKDVLCWMEMGFIGKWGEMHTSSSGHNVPNTVGLTASGKAIFRKAISVFPSDRFVSVRYPQIIFRDSTTYGSLGYLTPLNSTTAYNGSEQSKIGSWYANFGAGDILYHLNTEFATYWTPQTEFMPYWAHCDHFEDVTMDSYQWMNEATIHKYVALSNPKDESTTVDIYNRWVSDGLYDDFANKLGYRFRLIDGVFPLTMPSNAQANFTINMKNDGWARITNPRKVEIIFRNTSTGVKYVMDIDNGKGNRLWLPKGGETKVLSISQSLPTGITTGTYELLLNLPDPMPSLQNNPNYSIRLGNQNVWESSTGYNKLLANVTITSSSSDVTPPTAPTNLQSSNIKCSSLTLSWTASTDNVGVSLYYIYSGSTLLAATGGTSYTLAGLTPNTNYSFTVKAKDAVGNTSASSAAHSATTLNIGQNMLVNPGFESSTTGWTIWGTPTIVTTNQRSGTSCMKLTTTNYIERGQEITTGFSAGNTLSFSGWFRFNNNSATTNGNIGLMFYNGTTALGFSSTAVLASIGNTYTKFTHTATVPASTTRVIAWVANDDNSRSLFVDDMTLYNTSNCSQVAARQVAASAVIIANNPPVINREKIKIYPNPVGSYLYVDNYNGLHFEIVSNLGQVVSKGIKTGSSINVANLKTGAYFIRFVDSDLRLIASKKFIKK